MKLRNKILLFIAMKILEISGIICIPYFLGKLYKLIPIFKEEKFGFFSLWAMGIFGAIVTIAAIYVICGCIYGIIKWCKWNWNFIERSAR